jgi:hypothetical protein
VLTWLGYLPHETRLINYIKPQLRSIIGTWHDTRLPFLIGNTPTVGQSIYISIIIILSIVFFSIGYKTRDPERTLNWYSNKYRELMAYWMWRTRVPAYMLSLRCLYTLIILLFLC